MHRYSTHLSDKIFLYQMVPDCIKYKNIPTKKSKKIINIRNWKVSAILRDSQTLQITHHISNLNQLSILSKFKSVRHILLRNMFFVCCWIRRQHQNVIIDKNGYVPCHFLSFNLIFVSFK